MDLKKSKFKNKIMLMILAFGLIVSLVVTFGVTVTMRTCGTDSVALFGHTVMILEEDIYFCTGGTEIVYRGGIAGPRDEQCIACILPEDEPNNISDKVVLGFNYAFSLVFNFLFVTVPLVLLYLGFSKLRAKR